MSEDDVIRRLGRFTPAAGVSRDDLLFAAGRASARTPRGWKWATGVLAVSQVATLGLFFAFWRAGGVSPPSAATPKNPENLGGLTPPARQEPASPSEPSPDSYLTQTRNMDPDRPPPFVAAAGPTSARPLTVWSIRTDELD